MGGKSLPPQSVVRDFFSKAIFQQTEQPVAQLSNIEMRLINLTIQFLLQTSLMLRIGVPGWSPGDPPLPLTPEIMSKSVALAFAAAVEIEKPLREIRDQLTNGGAP